MRQRSALAQVGSPAAREKRSVFPRAFAEVTYFHNQRYRSNMNSSYFGVHIKYEAYKATKITKTSLAIFKA
ncbi:hypothetical protein [Oceanobacillus saliphilus]|uniref:hypothetical protein n=1 Tax=Oceanobacillus saliphilus TaxID=2925834 RepID=UPI00201DCBEB|nr:hypothetical protein [Oceanobacillus saliphilus]